MVRGLQPIGRHRQGRGQKRLLGGAIDIAGEQQALAIGLYVQYTGFRVAINCVWPLPQFKGHAVPRPLFTADTRLSVEKRRQPFGFTTDDPFDRQSTGDSRRTAGMIGIGMAQ